MNRARWFLGVAFLSAVVILPAAVCGSPAQASSPAQEVGKAAAKKAAKRLGESYQKLGKRHVFAKPTRLERVTPSVRADRSRGLPGHSFWYRPHPGRKGTAAHVQRKLAIHHPVKRAETMVVRPGTKYHERPIRAGAPHQREVILEHRTPGRAIQPGPRLEDGRPQR